MQNKSNAFQLENEYTKQKLAPIIYLRNLMEITKRKCFATLLPLNISKCHLNQK